MSRDPRAGGRFAGGLLAVALLATAGPAHGHGRSMSTSSWEIQLGARPVARIVVRVALADLEALAAARGAGGARTPVLEHDADTVLVQRFRLLAGGTPCALLGGVSPLPSADPALVARGWSVRCEVPGPLTLHADAFFDLAPAHLHLARVRVGDAKPFERVLVLERPDVPIENEPARTRPESGSGLADYLKLGIEHIVTGVDHLAFLLALLLAGRSVGQVATIVTGFTVAHSVTLALGVLGVIRPASAAIESLIGLSIAIVALENFVETVGAGLRRRCLAGLGLVLAAALAASLAHRFVVPAVTLAGVGLFMTCYVALLGRVGRPETLRWLIAFVFGLVHGFGFAGALAESALPTGRLAHALFGFNLGVEIGQLAIVVALWPALRLLLRGSEGARALGMQLGSTPVLAAGLFWFVSRAWG